MRKQRQLLSKTLFMSLRKCEHNRQILKDFSKGQSKLLAGCLEVRELEALGGSRGKAPRVRVEVERERLLRS